MAHPFSNRPAFEGLNDDIFGFGDGAALDASVASQLVDHARALLEAKTAGDMSVWSGYRDFYHDAISVLQSGDLTEINKLTGDLYGTSLTHGFCQGHIVTPALRTSLDSRMHVGRITVDRFYRLAEAVGAVRMLSAEHGQTTIAIADLDGIMNRIEDAIGADLPPIKQSGSIFGLRIRGAIYSDRHFDGIYGAWRARELAREAEITNPSLIEIGGGAGFLSFYARKFGFRRVAIIDLPQPGLVQYLVLASEFGAHRVGFGAYPEDGIGLIEAGTEAAQAFPNWTIAVNVDSLPEMSPAAASGYLASLRPGQMLLSINQESAVANGDHAQNVVSDLARQAGLQRLHRTPSWLRTGYVEEVFLNTNRHSGRGPGAAP